MATGPKIVHKQFNSPIGLYSQRNIQDTLNKHLQNLDNGTVGIDFSDPTTDKPGNLANSAVLRLLEEEEHGRRRPGQKKVVWPPVPETNGYHQPQHQQQQSPAFAPHSPSAKQQRPQYHSPQAQPQYHSPQPQPQYHSPQYQEQQHQQNQPAYCDGKRQEATGLSKLIPFGPGVTASPTPAYRQGPPSPIAAEPYKQPSSRWAPVPAPLSPQPAYNQQPQYLPQQQQYSPQQQQYSPQQQQYSPQQQQYSQPDYAPPQYTPPEYPPQYDYQPPQRQFEPPPATITLRQQPPVHQKPPPVFSSQPATASYQGGVNMRGDQKWPPQTVREAVAAENEARMQLAKGPACRPRKVKKDYSNFFAAHALNQSYPGYRAPPGTQHYEDHSGRSSY
ncbi:uncharacterized protein isoform X1 [Choristoneura fumiferana]|uniref:uncharacterized protein isoform X1 n=1 Tax=Choristoneura fumiferana TaxID=7141 RepID=UPI003D159EEF